MNSISQKLQKYKTKYTLEKNPNKRNVYAQKIKYYAAQAGGAAPAIQGEVSSILSDISKLKTSINAQDVTALLEPIASNAAGLSGALSEYENLAKTTYSGVRDIKKALAASGTAGDMGSITQTLDRIKFAQAKTADQVIAQTIADDIKSNLNNEAGLQGLQKEVTELLSRNDMGLNRALRATIVDGHYFGDAVLTTTANEIVEAIKRLVPEASSTATETTEIAPPLPPEPEGGLEPITQLTPTTTNTNEVSPPLPPLPSEGATIEGMTPITTNTTTNPTTLPEPLPRETGDQTTRLEGPEEPGIAQQGGRKSYYGKQRRY